MTYNLDFILQATKGKLFSSPHQHFSGYSCDSRDPQISGKIFIPLVGESQDAHRFIQKAVESGATGVMFHKWDEAWENLKDQASFIEVPDTLKALQDFSKAWRQNFQGKVLGLTGSNGKTTTKDFLYQILQNIGSTHASQGSFNNHWGVPFTLLDTKPATKFCIIEMGMNHAGEISRLMTLADPDFVMVTNVGRAHMGNFKNGIDGVAAAKEEIYESAKGRAKLLFNIDNPYTQAMYNKFMDRPSFTFSTKNFSADVYFRIKNKTAKGIEIEGQIGGVLGKAQLHFWGDHNVDNLAAAVCMAYVAGAGPENIWPLLEKCHAGWGRNQWLKAANGASILFDGYNANPDSFNELLKNVKELVESNPNCFAVFGEMLELGEQSTEQHRMLGEAAGQLPWGQALFIGPSGPSFQEGWEASENRIKPIILNTYKDSLDLDLVSMVDKQSLIIVKGSRGGALERIVDRFSPVDFLSK